MSPSGDVYTRHVAHTCALASVRVCACEISGLSILLRIFTKPTNKPVTLCLFLSCKTMFVYLIAHVTWHTQERLIDANKDV